MSLQSQRCLAVREALGCLVPEGLHPRLDGSGRKSRGQTGAGTQRVGVHLEVDGWRISVFDEEALAEGKAVTKGFMEFFLKVARRVCETLRLNIAIGSHVLGERLAESGQTLETVRRGLEGWKHWHPEEVRAAGCLLVPVPAQEGKSVRDWFLVSVRSASGEGERLAQASSLHVSIQDRCGRATVGERVAGMIDGVVRGVKCGPGDRVSVEQGRFPDCSSSVDSCLVVLGLVFARIAQEAKVGHLDPFAASYVHDFRGCLARAMGMLRIEADRLGDRDVGRGLCTESLCSRLLAMLAERPRAERGAQQTRQEGGSRVTADTESSRDPVVLRALT